MTSLLFDELMTVHPLLQRCRQRVLIVEDGFLFFVGGGNGFGLSLFLAELAKLSPTPEVTTAHRSVGVAADIDGFRFDQDATGNPKWKPVTLANYDQVWLFGAESNQATLPDPEVQVLAAFMEAGGGVFATGDHERLGYTLCSQLPRIRKMRDWFGVPMSVERIDTVWDRATNDPSPEFHDQSDAVPQRIFPHYYASGASWAPHPILRGPNGDLDVLPDHPHESQCLPGYALGQPYQLAGLNLVEFPAGGGGPLAPEVIATSMSAGRFLADLPSKPPTTPRSFGAVSAWDGHPVGRGRVVCDATWHHFIDINLDGTGAASGTGNRNGLRAGNPLQFTGDFHKVATYYRNTVRWLSPPTRTWCRWFPDLVFEKFKFPLIEEWKPLPHPCPWEPRVELGRLVENALCQSQGRGAATELVTGLLRAWDEPALALLLGPARPRPRRDERRTLFNVDEARQGFLGSIFDAVAKELPATLDDLGRSDGARAGDAAEERARAAVGDAKENFLFALDRALTATRTAMRRL